MKQKQKVWNALHLHPLMTIRTSSAPERGRGREERKRGDIRNHSQVTGSRPAHGFPEGC